MYQFFTEGKRAKVETDELNKDLEIARENAKIRHYDIALNVESLRTGLKLNFHDTQTYAFEREFERYKLSEYQSKHAETPRHVNAAVGQSGTRGRNYFDRLEDSQVQSTKTAKTPVKSNKTTKQDVEELRNKDKLETDLRYSDIKDGLRHIKSSRRIKYDREFLLQFRDCAYALQKPQCLPDIKFIIPIPKKVITPRTRAQTTKSDNVQPSGGSKFSACPSIKVAEKVSQQQYQGKAIRQTDAGGQSDARGKNYSDVLEESGVQSKTTAKTPVKSNNRTTHNVKELHNKEELEAGLCYSDIKDVWSPLKATRKIQYSREFLLQFHDCAKALQKPKDLPDIPKIILTINKVLTPITKAQITESDNSLPSRGSNSSTWQRKELPEKVSQQQYQGQAIRQTDSGKQNVYKTMYIGTPSPYQMPVVISTPMYKTNQTVGSQQSETVMGPNMLQIPVMPKPQISRNEYIIPTRKPREYPIRIVDPSCGKDVTMKILGVSDK